MTGLKFENGEKAEIGDGIESTAESVYPKIVDGTLTFNLNLTAEELAEFRKAIGADKLKSERQIILDALARQMLRKPIRVVYPHTTITSHHECFECAERVCNGWKYCPECGQAIDWKGDKNDG